MDANENRQAESVDLTRFRLEEHVEESFRTAWALAEGQPINARHALLAALIVSGTTPSPAFSKLASLLPLTGLGKPQAEQTSSAELGALLLDSPLAAAYSVAEPFLLETEREVWGRDYVTLALLAVEDPSLQEVAKEGGSTLETLQDEWFRFVTSESAHRSAESWTKWWRSAGVPLPDKRAPHRRGVWINVASPTENGRDLRNLKKGEFIPWAVPRHCSKDDYVLMWVTEGTGFLYVLQADEPPRPPAPDEHGPMQTRLVIREKFENSITMQMLRDDAVLAKWDLVVRNMQGATKGKVKSLLDTPDLWRAFRKLALRHNPDLRELFQEIDPQPMEVYEVASHFLDDQPSTVDRLGHDDVVQALAGFLKNEKTSLPLAIGIDAPWGAGKSSVMKMLREELQPRVTKEDERAQTDPWERPWSVTWKQLVDGTKDWKAMLRKSRAATETGGSWSRAWKKLVKRIRDWKGVLGKTRAAEETGESQKSPSVRKFETVYFNAWRHGTGTRLTASLVHHIMHSIANRRGTKEKELFWLAINLRRLDSTALRWQVYAQLAKWAITGVVVLVAVVGGMIWQKVAWSVVGGIGGGLAAVTTFAFNRWVFQRPVSFDFSKYIRAPDYLSWMGPQYEIENDFRALLQHLTDHGKTLVVFIDDLDRCSPAQTAEFVEAINVFFGQELRNCIFVLGMHRDLVATSLELAYEKLVSQVKESPALQEELPFGRRFLEKIVQFVVRLPEGDVDRFVSYLTGGSAKPRLSPDAKHKLSQELEQTPDLMEKEDTYRDQIKDKIVEEHGLAEKEATVVANELISYERAGRIARSYDETSPEVIRVFKAVRPALRSNPRQYVRFFNALRFEYHLAAFKVKRHPPLDELLDLAKQVVISLERPALWSLVVKQSGQYSRLSAAASKDSEFETELRSLLASDAPADKTEEFVKNYLADTKLRELLRVELTEKP